MKKKLTNFLFPRHSSYFRDLMYNLLQRDLAWPSLPTNFILKYSFAKESGLTANKTAFFKGTLVPFFFFNRGT